MTIEFRCEHCGKKVSAPDEAGGKRGKCPYCRGSNFIPAPVDESDLPNVVEPDESEVRRERQQREELRQQERALIEELGGGESVPLEQRDDVSPEDLYHIIVNYCLDIMNSNLERARVHVEKLNTFPGMARQAVDDVLAGKAADPALDVISEKLREGFLKQLRGELK